MKHLRFILMAALVAMPITACDEDDDPPVVDPIVTGTISGTVSVEGAGVAGVSVTLVGATSQSATTDAGGAYSFANVEAGSYGVAISDFPADVSFSTVSKTTSITTAGQTATVDFSGSYIRTASISGSVTADGSGLAAVAVTLTGPEGDKNAVTDAAGNYSSSGLRAGDYTVAIAVPEGYVFANSSFDVSVGVGEAQNVSFVGEAEVTVDPVTASVVITSVTNNAGQNVNPNNVAGQINITVNVDPGENDVQRVCVLLNGAEVANGCQSLGSAVAEGEMQQVLPIVFSIFTDDFDPVTGAPVYGNDTYELSAVLDLENATQSNVTTTMALVFNNMDEIVATLIPEFNELVSGDRWIGGLLDIEIVPVLYSGKELAETNVEFDWDDFTVDGPFPTTETFDFVGDDFTVFDEDIDVGGGEYTDDTEFGDWDDAVLQGTDIDRFNFDFEAPEFSGGGIDIELWLTDQVEDPELMCCSANWTGPQYMPIDGLIDINSGDNELPWDEGVGVDDDAFLTFYVDAFDALDDGDAPDGIAILQNGMMSDAGLPLSLTNDEHDLTVVATDLFGNWSWIALTSNGDSNDTDLVFGYDDTEPEDVSDPDDSHPNNHIYNAMSVDATPDVLDLAGTEDRSGFSPRPFRAFVAQYTPGDLEYPVGQDIDDGGPLNLDVGFTLPACAGDPDNGTPCFPNTSTSDGLWNVNGFIINQAGVPGAVTHDYWVFIDQEIPDVSNVGVPFSVDIGDDLTVDAEVTDNLHLGCTAFAFDFDDNDIFVPLGELLCDDDQDAFDTNFPEEDIHMLTISPAVVGLEQAAGGTPSGTVLDMTNVRATHTDLAGNQSNQEGNNFIAGTVESGDSYDTAGIDDFFVDIGGDVDICNGQGGTDCEDTADNDEFEVTVVAEGDAGTFANPFAVGKLYRYIVLDGGDTTFFTDDDTWYLLGTMDATDAVITDDGTDRQYTWEFDVTADDVSIFADGTEIWVTVMGVKDSEGVGLLADPQADVITVFDGAL